MLFKKETQINRLLPGEKVREARMRGQNGQD